MSRFKGNALVALALVLLVFLPGPQAQPAEELSPALADTQASRGIIENRIKALTSGANLDEDTKTKLTGLYQEALSNLDTIEIYQAKAAGYVETLEKLPEQTKTIRRRLETPAPEPEIEPLPPELSAAEVERLLAKEQAGIATVEAKLNALEQKLATWQQHLAQTRERILQAQSETERLDEIDQPTVEEDSPLFVEARRWADQARQQQLYAEIYMLNQDLVSHPVRKALVEAQRDESARDLELLRVRQQHFEDQLDQRRRVEAEQARVAAEAAQREAAGRHPLLGDLTEWNIRLTDELSELTKALAGIERRQAHVAEEAKRIRKELDNTRQQLEIRDLTEALGQTLIDQRKKLPDPRPYLKEAKERKQAIADTTLKQIHYDEELEQLRNLKAFADALTANREEPIPTELRKEIQELAQQRKSLLDKAATTTGVYLRALAEWDHASNLLLETIANYQDYLAENILWVRNARMVSLDTLRDLPKAIAWLSSPSNWLEVTQALAWELTNPSPAWLAILVALLLLWRSRAIRRAILATAPPLEKDRIEEDHTRSTFKAIGLTILIAIPWPLILIAVGWQLNNSLEATPFTKSVGHGVRSMAFALFSLQAFRLLCIPGGVANRHFRWPAQALRTIRQNFVWVIWFLVPMGIMIRIVFQYKQPAYSHSLGRIALIITMVGFALFIVRMIHPKKGVLSPHLAANLQGWLNRLKWLWYLLIIAAPLFLAGLAVFGYIHTAGVLLLSLIHELWLILGLILVHQLSMRWLTLSRQKLARREAGDQAVAQAQTALQTDPAGSGPALDQVVEPELDLAALDARTRKLVNSLAAIAAVVGLWVIYSDVLPALTVLQEYSLWTYSVTLDGQEQQIPVTLADVGLTLIILIIVLVALKNLPALLDIALLQHLSISASSRYTINTLLSHFIVIAGTLMAANILGLSWSQIQWLVAAFSVGIGFGLQEIIANFVSGLIILFERPIRVGDVVTVRNADGDNGVTTGVVSQIRIRATVVRNWDKQELLVPNKEFITGQLLNWTLSDQINRIAINLGVTYDADLSQAMTLLHEVVERDEQILKDPKPLITVEDFGEDAINIVLRCYLGSLGNRLSIISNLYQNINEEFRAAGIPVTGGTGKVIEGAD